MEELPSEIVNEILERVDHRDKLVARSVCRKWKEKIDSGVKQFRLIDEFMEACVEGDLLSIMKCMPNFPTRWDFCVFREYHDIVYYIMAPSWYERLKVWDELPARDLRVEDDNPGVVWSWAILLACSWGHVELVELLIKMGDRYKYKYYWSFGSEDLDGCAYELYRQCLKQAISFRNEEVVKVLIDTIDYYPVNIIFVKDDILNGIYGKGCDRIYEIIHEAYPYTLKEWKRMKYPFYRSKHDKYPIEWCYDTVLEKKKEYLCGGPPRYGIKYYKERRSKVFLLKNSEEKS